MQRRRMLATLGAAATGGCLRLQQTEADANGGGTADGSDPTGGGATDGGGATSDGTGSDADATATDTAADGGGSSLALSAAWTLDREASRVWVDDGQFFTTSFDGVSLASPADGTVWDTDPEDGGLTAYPSRAFAVGDDLVVFGFGADSGTDAGANFLAYDRATGERRWHVEMPDDHLHTRAKGAALAGETVVVAADHTGAGDDQRPLVYGVDRATGERRWQTGTPDLETVFVSGVTAHAEAVYVFQAYKGTSLLDPATGELREFRTSVRTSPWGGTTDGGTLFAAWNGSVVAYRLAGDGTRWSVEGVGETQLRPSVDDDLVVAGMETGHVYAIETDTGEQRWETRLDRKVMGTALSDAHVWAISEDSTLAAHDRSDGSVVYEETHDPHSSHLGVVDDTLLLAGDTARAYRIRSD